MPDQKKLIVVLGPHRSGTSLCTAALESLGAELRLPLQYKNEENQKGFFEHPDIVAFNDNLLAHLGGSWDNPLFDGPAAVGKAELSDWRASASSLFETIYGGAGVAAIKDPRLCQLLDFWMPVFAEHGYRDQDIFVVHVLRDPVEVALSQQQRSQDNPAYYEIGGQLVEGAALWLSLTAQALAQTGALKGRFVSYLELLSSPGPILNSLAAFLGLNPDQQIIETFCEQFVDSNLHRSIADLDATELLSNQFPQIQEFYAAMQLLCADECAEQEGIAQALAIYRKPETQMALSLAMSPAISRLSERSRSDRFEIISDLESQVADYASLVGPLRAQISQLEQGNTNLKEQLEDQHSEIENLRSVILELEYTVGEMEASSSWRMTEPVRRLGAFRNRVLERLLKATAKFRLKSIYKYQRMSVRHPRIAWTCRMALRPVFRLLNGFLKKNSALFPDDRFEGVLEPMLYQQIEASEDYQPLISIIVPNYNHADFLSLRLDSIYSQTYQNFEVILLDDASTDSSSDVLRHYQQTHAEKTTLIINEENSGGVFHQWRKGLQLAQGDIIWIAESDDWCSDNFLQTLVPFFENEAIQLAYSRTVFMDADDGEPHWTIDEYLHDIHPDRWAHPIVEAANKIVAEAFAIKNIIPNVSSAIFRNPGDLELLEDPQWQNMVTCGDWIFFLHLIRGGVLAYSPEACNYYRIHGSNISVKSHSDDVFYAEHEFVAKTVQKYYRVDTAAFRRQRDNLIAHWRETRPDFSEESFEACYSLSRIDAAAADRAPNLLMASYGFCTGGGETFPIQLANLMKQEGYNVTYLDCARAPRNEGVRKNLRVDIPVVSDFTQLERIVSDFGIDLIHSHHAWVDSTILDLLPDENNCKTVVTLHGMYETINSVDLKFILPRLVKRSSRLIYVAEKNVSALVDHKLDDAKKLARIENALPVTDFAPVVRSDLDIPEDAFVLTLVSRAMEDKGWQEAIEIVSLAREMSGKDIHLLLVGDGIEYDRLKRSELPVFIHLEGFQRNVRGYFAVADMGFLPSKFRGESFPMVIIECLQVGRPVLSSSLGDIPYMLGSPDGVAGVLVDLEGDEINITLWAEKVSHLALDMSACESLYSRVSAAAEKFDSEVMTKKYDDVYRSVLQELTE